MLAIITGRIKQNASIDDMNNTCHRDLTDVQS